MDTVNKWITLLDISCGSPARGLRFEYFPVGIIPAEKMWAEGDAEGLINVLVNHDSASGKRDPQMRGLNLKNNSLEGDGVIVPHSALFFDGEDEIKIQMSLDRNKGRARLFGFDGEAFVVLTDINFFQETIGILFGFDAVEAKFIAQPALESSIDSFATASGLRRVSGDGSDAQLCDGAANLSEMSFQNFAAGFGSEEEVASPVGV